MTANLNSKQRKLLAWLSEIAAIGEAAPAIAAMRRRLGLAHDSYAEEVLTSLADAGQIAIDGEGRTRVIRISSTGDTTKLPAAGDHARDELPPTIRRPTAKGDALQRILAVGREIQGKPSEPDRRETVSAPRHRREPAQPPAEGTAELPAPVSSPTEEVPMVKTTAADIAAAPAIPGLKADVEFSDGELRLTVWLSTDPGPMKAYRPFLTVPLNEFGAMELMGTTAIALRDARKGGEAAR